MCYYKFHHLQVPNDAKKGTFGILSQVVVLLGRQDIVERCFTAHIKAIAHINRLSKNSAICKCQMTLKSVLLVPCLNWQNWD